METQKMHKKRKSSKESTIIAGTKGKLSQLPPHTAKAQILPVVPIPAYLISLTSVISSPTPLLLHYLYATAQSPSLFFELPVSSGCFFCLVLSSSRYALANFLILSVLIFFDISYYTSALILSCTPDPTVCTLLSLFLKNL
jgi:hypothetical protein